MSGEQPAIPGDGRVERRRKPTQRLLVPDQLKDGWLAFQLGAQRRRLAPIPTDWWQLDDGALLELLRQAERIDVK